MKQMNLNVTKDFERDLRRFMKLRGIRVKSEAVRVAVREAGARAAPVAEDDFHSWLGMGLKAPLREDLAALSEDDLWS